MELEAARQRAEQFQLQIQALEKRRAALVAPTDVPVAHARLNEAERVQFVNFLTYVLRIWEELFLQHRRGLVDDEMWQANARIVRDTKPMPGARDTWAVRRHLFTEAFQHFFESLDSSQARPLYEVKPS